ncbi:hypothetical protein BBP40_007641 [Aspergillus hancockii]|nr:hypothetical protein BBP40_007641 [Aspergillus hancockii]
MSSILAWVRKPERSPSEPGSSLTSNCTKTNWLDKTLTTTCKTALTAQIHYHPYLEAFDGPMIGKYIEHTTFADELCDAGCGDSPKDRFDSLLRNCGNQTFGNVVPTLEGGYIYAGYESMGLER